jgi:hypothetical protein
MEVKLLEVVFNALEPNRAKAVFVMLLDRVAIVEDVDRRGIRSQSQAFQAVVESRVGDVDR